MKQVCYALLAMGLIANANANALDSESGLFKDKDKELFRTATAGTLFSLKMNTANHGGTITISGPDNFYISYPFESTSLTLNLLEKHNKLSDGRYSYEVKAHTGKLKLVKDTIDNGRGENNYTYAGKSVSYSGSFVVESGNIKTFAQHREGSSNEW